MKVKMLFSMAAAAAITMGAQADITGIELRPYEGAGWAANGYAGLDTYRLYLIFDSPDDQLNAIFGNADNPLSWNTDAPDGFFNSAAFNSLTAPLDLTSAGIWANQWDTYVTIDTDQNDGDATALSPGFAAEVGDLNGNFSTTNASYFVTVADLPQGLADGGEVLIGQITVASTAGPGMTEVSGVVHAQLAGGAQFTGLEFSSIIPTPGALALLGLAGLAGTRRRRG